MIHLTGPILLSAALAGLGVYGLLARRNAVLVLIGAELLLNAANVLLVTVAATDPLISGQALAVFVVTIAAAEIGLALAVILLLFRARRTSDLTAVRQLGEAAPQDPPSPAETDPATTAHEAALVGSGAGKEAVR